MKSTVGLLVAPLAPVMAFIVPSLWEGGGLEVFSGLGTVIIPTYIVSFLSLLLVGLPIVYFLEGRNLTTMPFLLAAGVASGILCWVLFSWFFATLLGSKVEFKLSLLAVGGGYGFITSLTYGLVARVRWRYR